jgi:serine/threonine-protein kinase HipA
VLTVCQRFGIDVRLSLPMAPGDDGMSTLRVLANGASVGTTEVMADGRWSFAYAPDWSLCAIAQFSLATRSYQDSGDAAPVEWFFENLLPEGRLRELIASRDRIDPKDTWALLIRHGQDTAGALSLIPDEIDHPDVQERLVPLAREALQEKIEESRTRNLPLMASWDDIRMSLAGAQEKLGLRIDANGALFLPEGTAPRPISSSRRTPAQISRSARPTSFLHAACG